MSETIAAIATGMSVSAIGIIRLSGDSAIEIADRVFRSASGEKLCSCQSRKLLYGALTDEDGGVLDMCLCTVSRAPHSYTGEDTAELQCHGSPAVLRAAMELLFRCGARQAAAGEFTRRAFLNGRMELTQAEAVADLIDAENAESARNAAGQLSGAISRKSDKIYSDLADISAHYHAVLDYPDEDIEDFLMESYRRSISDALHTLRSLLSTFERGRVMNSGIPAVIAGRPNAGKSSLMNALLGYERAIVTRIPGTTRDTVEEKIQIGAVTLRLTDTAGLRQTEDEVERLGVERSRRALEKAALVLAVIDGSAPLTDGDREVISLAESAPKGVIVYSKRDLGTCAEKPLSALPWVEISSATGEGLKELEQTIAALFPLPDVPAGEILTNVRQAEAIGRAAEYLEAALRAMDGGLTPDIVLTETEGAMEAIGELSGRTLRQDITDRIFSRFCVGK